MGGRQFARPRSRRGGEREQLLHARARLVRPAAQPARRRVNVLGEAARDIPRRSILANVGRPAFARRRGAAAADARCPRPHELRELTPLAEVGRQRLGAERRRVGVRARARVVPPTHLRVRLVGLEADERLHVDDGARPDSFLTPPVRLERASTQLWQLRRAATRSAARAERRRWPSRCRCPARRRALRRSRTTRPRMRHSDGT